MRSILKRICILLAGAGILLLCAGFPEMAARLQDPAGNTGPQYSAVTPVKPEQRPTLSASDKLILLSQKNPGIEISEDETTMSASHVNAAAEKAFAPYLTAGLLPSTEDFYRYSRPLLIQDPGSPERHCIVWEVCRIQSSPPNSVIDVLIDDETGNILRLYYDAGQLLFGQYELGTNLNTFVDIYFNALGIRDHGKYLLGEPYYSEEICRVQYRVQDTDAGTVTLDFVCLCSGFYVTFL